MIYRKMKTIPANYFSKHMLAMTEENLNSKADIAQELAGRDYIIDLLLDGSYTDILESSEDSDIIASLNAARRKKNDE